MSVFFEYLRNITYFLVFMAIVGVIAPSGAYKKYISLVMGIMLIGIVLAPIPPVLGRNPVPVTEIFGNITPVPMGDWQPNHLLDAFHAQLTAQLQSKLAGESYRLISADWETAEDFTHILRLSLIAEPIDTGPAPRPFIRIEPIRIAPYQASEESDETLAVKKLLADFYDMSVSNIHVEIRGKP